MNLFFLRSKVNRLDFIIQRVPTKNLWFWFRQPVHRPYIPVYIFSIRDLWTRMEIKTVGYFLTTSARSRAPRGKTRENVFERFLFWFLFSVPLSSFAQITLLKRTLGQRLEFEPIVVLARFLFNLFAFVFFFFFFSTGHISMLGN